MQGDDGEEFDDEGNAIHGFDDDHEYLDSAGEEEFMDSGDDDKVFTYLSTHWLTGPYAVVI